MAKNDKSKPAKHNNNDKSKPLVKPNSEAEPFKIDQGYPLWIMLNPISWILWLLDFVVWLVTLVFPLKCMTSFCTRGSQGVMVSGSLRYAKTKDRLITTPKSSCRSVHDLVQETFKKYPEKRGLGTRTYLGTHQVEGQKIPLQKFGVTRWTRYEDVGKRVKYFGRALRHVGMEPCPLGVDLQTVSGPHTVLIYEETCAAWMIATLGCFSQSIAVATSYATLGISAVAEAIIETNAKTIVCNIKDVEKVVRKALDKCPTLECVVYTTNKSELTTLDTDSFPGGFTILSMDEFNELGRRPLPPGVNSRALESREIANRYGPDADIEMGAGPIKNSNNHVGDDMHDCFVPPTGDTLAVIMYTSGSTGKPKGVMIKHKQMVASIGGVQRKLFELDIVGDQEHYIAYLPAAHILELTAELSMVCLGASVGFACPKTISSKGACRQCPNGDVNMLPGYPYPPGGIQEFRPTLMAAVPKIWDIMKKGVEEKLTTESSIKKFLVQSAFTGRNMAVQQGRKSFLLNKLVFDKLKAMMGGRLKIAMTGGGPISGEVQNFIRIMFNVPLLQGYALTETTCAGTIQAKDDIRNNVVGSPVPSVELKLRSCIGKDGEPELLDRKGKPYKVTDTSHYGLPCMGRGEVLIRGPSVSSGYFKLPEKTAEVFMPDGFFLSGDVGLFTPDGCLMIIDRIKNLVKLKGGEYIAIEAMEKDYGTSSYVDGVNGGIMCYGDGSMDRPIALVQVNVRELEKWASRTGVSYSDIEELAGSPQAEKMVLADLVRIGKETELGSNEILCGVALIPGTGSPTALTERSPWTPENMGLTASNKLNRKPIEMACFSMMERLKALGTR